MKKMRVCRIAILLSTFCFIIIVPVDDIDRGTMGRVGGYLNHFIQHEIVPCLPACLVDAESPLLCVFLGFFVAEPFM